jgi:hypothetical protein
VNSVVILHVYPFEACLPFPLVIITGTSASVPVSVEARYAEGVLDAGLSAVSISSVSCPPVEGRSTAGYVLYTESESEAIEAEPATSCMLSVERPSVEVHLADVASDSDSVYAS